jgi:Flp pilus assembly protein protease CpaA
LLDGIKRLFNMLIGRKKKESKGLKKETTLPYGIAIAVGTLAAIALSG